MEISEQLLILKHRTGVSAAEFVQKSARLRRFVCGHIRRKNNKTGVSVKLMSDAQA